VPDIVAVGSIMRPKSDDPQKCEDVAWQWRVIAVKLMKWQQENRRHALFQAASKHKVMLIGAQIKDAEDSHAREQAESAQEISNLQWAIQQMKKELADARNVEDSLRSNVVELQDAMAEVKTKLRQRHLYEVIFPHGSPHKAQPARVPRNREKKKKPRLAAVQRGDEDQVKGNAAHDFSSEPLPGLDAILDRQGAHLMAEMKKMFEGHRGR